MQNYIIETIINSLVKGDNVVTVRGEFGKGEVGRLAKQIKAVAKGRDVFVKDMTSYYQGYVSKSKREECRKFEVLAEDSLFRPFKRVCVLQEDGTIGVNLVLAPFCVLVINYKTIDKIRQKRELSLLSRVNKKLSKKLSKFEYDLSDFAKVKERLYALTKQTKHDFDTATVMVLR